MSVSVSLKALYARATLYQNLREFFKSRRILEVETPIFSDAFLIKNECRSLTDFNLPISAMQQLILAGSGAIYQICKQFRLDDIDRRHRPEFSVVQWNQPDWNHEQVLHDLTALLHAIFEGEFEPERRTFQQAFIRRLGFDPQVLSADELREQARRLGLNASLGDDRLAWLKLMFIHFIEPTLGHDIPLYLTDLPLSWRNTEGQSESPVRSDTDVYIDGIKVGSILGNISGNEHKNSQTQPNLNIVLGLDRLLMIVLETRQIENVWSLV